eukprot:5218964-Prorocentrum_lima.AAC.1
MTSSLVGSEMCIRDRPSSPLAVRTARSSGVRCGHQSCQSSATTGQEVSCLLYTSDAADDM